MSDTTQENDPSIEEILASIRQIISDDDEEAQAEGAEEEPVAAAEETEDDKEDVLELTEKADEPEEEIAEEIQAEPEPEPEPEEEPMEEPVEDEIEVDLAEVEEEEQKEDPPAVDTSDLDTEILTQSAAAATLAGFTKIARDIQVNRTFDGITLEDIVRAQLEPLLREWLDKNLPPMIEVLVEKELEKLSKKALND